MEQRLQKLLAAAGVASRRGAEKIIAAGRVAVDGEVVTDPATKVDPDQSTITVDGRPIQLNPDKVYVVVNKPRGYTSTRRDPHARHVVTELVSHLDASLFPVGRLDVDTEGLMVLTNDGNLAFKLSHPKYRVPKTYQAEVRGLINTETISRLRRGVLLEDGPAMPSNVRLVRHNSSRGTSVVELTLTEGRKREVRRIFDTVGHPVIRLVRVSIASLRLGRLKPGECRRLTPNEVDELLSSVSE